MSPCPPPTACATARGHRCPHCSFTIIAADCTVARSIITYKHDEDKIMQASNSLVLASAGPVADRLAYSESMAANIKLYSLRNGIECDVSAAAHYCRRRVSSTGVHCAACRCADSHVTNPPRAFVQLADALRKAPYQVNVLIAGVDKAPAATGGAGGAGAGASGGAAAKPKAVPGLYFMDYMASLHKMNYAAHGYAGFFLYALLDRHWEVRALRCCALLAPTHVACTRVGPAHRT